MPRFRPCPPNGECTWAASPASSTRPRRYVVAWRALSVNRVRVRVEPGHLGATPEVDAEFGGTPGEDLLERLLVHAHEAGDRTAVAEPGIVEVDPVAADHDAREMADRSRHRTRCVT